MTTLRPPTKCSHLLCLLAFLGWSNAFVAQRQQTPKLLLSNGKILPFFSIDPFDRSKTSFRSVQLCQLSAQQDNRDDQSEIPALLVWMGVALVVACSLATLWSEVSIFQTGCGPLYLPDALERISYQVVIAVFSVSWFLRVAFSQDAVDWVLDKTTVRPTKARQTASSLEPKRLLLQAAQALTYAVVLSSVIVLLNQIVNDVDVVGGGLSGIDEVACKARLGFQQEMLVTP
mmetsp:Transcript_1185/g.3308  ORF Transcript_1185/g.3308 Transcript_1185/m.3308 type:complete len:231 (-) Transcript_1185:4312-5004(-)|eukprot:CAMPEP_0168799244 /NCGR_PEP_ID=MMETSP0725-20121227/18327_1 /TAXON_ID=265536 /ORGANISM="Amphiprora sp., Strain CCMP467" /LENGTH=230 /DNA_ID=CAMNT_0008850697 /DNA_START=31 /DNA_END=723 /DNA_ORIENTATION=+